MATIRRKKRLVKPRLQLKLVVIFLCLASACILVQFALLSAAMTRLALALPDAGLQLTGAMTTALWKHLLVTLGLLVPLTLSVGILVTSKIAGPVYRFETHLRAIARGEPVRPCRIRRGDELQELCGVMNDALAALDRRAREASGGAVTEGTAEEEPAAAR